MANLNRKEKGKIAEKKVENYLKGKGYVILENNYAVHNIGEIDIIARKGKTLVVVEVRSLDTESLDLDPLETIKPVKRNRIITTAAIYLQDNKRRLQWMEEMRFDLGSVLIKAGKYELRYVKEAFGARDSWL